MIAKKDIARAIRPLGTGRPAGSAVSVFAAIDTATASTTVPMQGLCEPVLREQVRCDQTILIAEDTADVRDLMRAVLVAAGYRVLCSTGGPDALQLGERHAGHIDLLITDWQMPKMAGDVLAQRLAARRPEMKVLMISGFPVGPEDGDGRHFAFLQKPFRLTDLTGAVERALAT